MMPVQGKVRKIAANYIFLPGKPLLKNGHVVWHEDGGIEMVDTNGQIRDIAGLEFYGGMLVPAYVLENKHLFIPGQLFLTVLESLYGRKGTDFSQLAIIEGADLREFVWKADARVRKL